MTSARIVTRIGLSTQVPILKPGELGYDTDTRTLRVGDDTPTPPSIITSKTVSFDLTNLKDLQLSQEVLDVLAHHGTDGWTPVLATEAYHNNTALKVIDWVGGAGIKPDYPVYVGENGFVNDINLASNLSGKPGLNGSAPVVSFSMDESGNLMLNVLNPDETMAPINSYVTEDGDLMLEYEPLNGTTITTNLGKVLVTFRGDYNEDTEYFAMDEIRHEGKLFRVKVGLGPIIGVEPEEDDDAEFPWLMVFNYNFDPGALVNRVNHTGVQAMDTITGLESALASKALSEHSHSIAGISGLVDALDGKMANPTGTVDEYMRGDGSIATLPATGVTSVGVEVPEGFESGPDVTSSGDLIIAYAAGYRGFTDDLATQIATSVKTTGNQSVAGVKTFTGAVNIQSSGSNGGHAIKFANNTGTTTGTIGPKNTNNKDLHIETAGKVVIDAASKEVDFLNSKLKNVDWSEGGGPAPAEIVAVGYIGDGTTTVFAIPRIALMAENAIVHIDTVWQRPNDSYTVSGLTLTFTEAPADNAIIDILVVAQLADFMVPSAQSVTAASITNDPDEQRAIRDKLKVNDGLPVGATIFSSTGFIFPGHFEMDGSTFDEVVYPDLYEYLGTNVLPDTRDRYLRHVGPSTTAVGTTREDAMQRITGSIDGIPRSFTPPVEGALGFVDTTTAVYTTGASGRILSITFDSGNSPGAKVDDNETHGKEYIGKWLIKAASVPINPGRIDVTALAQTVADISPMANGAVRGDIDQNAQAASSEKKINLLKNTLQAWEQIGSIVTLAADAAQIDFTNLGAYRELRLNGRVAPVTADQHIIFRVGDDTGIISTNEYFVQSTSFSGTIVSASRAFYTFGYLTAGGGPGSNAGSRGYSFEARLHDFNKLRTTMIRSSGLVTPASGDVISATSVTHFAENKALDRLRIQAVSGQLLAGSYLILEGIRG